MIDKSDRSDPLFAVSITSFEDPKLDLGPLILKGLYEMKFSRPSKIQAASLPKIKVGRNLLAQAHNGTGKTCCFVLGMLWVVNPEPVPQALCVCPTRELAKQIEEEVLKMGKYLILEKGIKIKCILREERWARGEKIQEQIVIGTPGKIVSLLNIHVLDPAGIRMFVLDEADEMLMLGGLGDQSKRIRQRLRKDVQTLFFSATYTDPVKRLATQLAMDNPWSQIEVKREHIFNDQVAQYYYRTNGVREKMERLTEILSVVNVGQCIIFVHLRDTVDKLADTLTANGHPVSPLHGRMESTARDKVLVDFRSGTTRFLVTTNVLSRGYAGAWNVLGRGAVPQGLTHAAAPAQDRRACGDPRHQLRHARAPRGRVRPRHLPASCRSDWALRPEGLGAQHDPRRGRTQDPQAHRGVL